ncbi:MAG: ABC transporter ATP-binding protein [Elusimicrobia bacterium]|nr:ABC transporter ATP-binding protein [Elusimicrobiota bacterium]
MKNTLSIQISDVHKRLGPNQALAGATLSLEAGGLYGLIGPDGAGKTTLLRTVVGLLRPDSGCVTFRVDGLTAAFEEARPSIAYMPQQQSLYPDLSIKEHLEFFRDLYQISNDLYVPRRDRLLHLTRLEKFQNRPAGQLSGGCAKAGSHVRPPSDPGRPPPGRTHQRRGSHQPAGILGPPLRPPERGDFDFDRHGLHGRSGTLRGGFSAGKRADLDVRSAPGDPGKRKRQ